MGIAIVFLVAVACLHFGQLLMKAKVARQIDYGIRQERIRIEIDGQPIESTSALYSVICAGSYPQK